MHLHPQGSRQGPPLEFSPSASELDPTRVVWIDRESIIPDVCITCGMFTDRRVKVKADQVVIKPAGQASLSMALISIVMHVMLGPVGWLVTLMFKDDEGPPGTKAVIKKTRIRVAQCQLCHASQPVESLMAENHRFAFLVHPRFKQELDLAN